MAFANLVFGTLGILCIWLRGTFWTATVIGTSILLLGAAVVHIQEMRRTGNFAPGNAGPVFITDILTPIVLLGLLVAYKS